MYPRTLILNPSGSGAFTFATLPVAALMSGEVAGVQAYTSDEGMCYWDGGAWHPSGASGEGLVANTYAAARLLSGVTTGDRLQVLGRTTQSDGGQGLFTWVAGGTTTINDGSQLSAPGGIWQRPDVTINAQWYGIDPTGVTASDVALNLAIQDAIIQKKKLVVPAGVFRLENSLLLYPTPTWHFATVYMEGQGGTAPGGLSVAIGGVQFPNGPAYPRTTFYANFTDRPALIINAGRSIILKDFCISGKNMIGVDGINTNYPYPPTSDLTKYVTGGCRDSRYSPYAGICIDPFTCNTPPDGGYPGFTYPVAGSAASGTHDLMVERVGIDNFVVSVMNGPGTTNANGDCYTFRDVGIYGARVAYACGDTQARQINIYDGEINYVNCAFDSVTYGNQLGSPFRVEGTNLESVYGVMNYFTGGGAGLRNCYGESIVWLGRAGGQATPTGKTLEITDCEFYFSNIAVYPNDGTPGCPPVILICSGPMKASGTIFSYAFNVIEAWNFVLGSAPGLFESCYFTGAIEARRIPLIGIGRSLTNANLVNCYINGAATGGQSQVISDVLPRTGSSSLTVYGNGIGRLNPTYQTRLMPDVDARSDYAYIPPGAGVWNGSTVGIPGVSALTLNATTVTFTVTNASQFFCEKDILCWSMLPQFGVVIGSLPALKIPVGGISGNNVTANMLWPPATYDIVANQPSTTIVDLCLMQWAPTGILTCTTNGTTSLTAVSPVNTLIPGDCIIGAGPNGGDIPSSIGGGACRVVSTDGAGNVTISKAATGSHTGVGLRFGYLSPITPVIKTVATLPPGVAGLRYMVSDATAPAFGAAVVGGGAVRVPVFADNTGTWIVG